MKLKALALVVGAAFACPLQRNKSLS